MGSLGLTGKLQYSLHWVGAQGGRKSIALETVSLLMSISEAKDVLGDGLLLRDVSAVAVGILELGLTLLYAEAFSVLVFLLSLHVRLP